MASGGSISVDVGGLHELAGRLRSVQGSLVSDTGMFNEGANGVEHPVLRHELNRFEERWSDKRNRIHEALGVVAKGFDTVAQSFDDMDHELERALNGSGPAPSSVYRVDEVAVPEGPGVLRVEERVTPISGSTAP